MNGLIYAGLYEGKGSGHLLRMVCLVDSIKNNYGWKIDITTNNNEVAEKLFKTLDINLRLRKEPYYIKYDFILIDSPNEEIDLIKNLKIKTDLLICLDYIYYNPSINAVINLFNHDSLAVKSYNENLLHGLKYSIIKKDILNISRKINTEIKCLITFGGEDPSSNSLKVVQQLKNKDIKTTLILGPLNRDKKHLKKFQSEKINIIPPTSQIGELIGSHDIIICGAGTTLLEAIYIGNPIIVLPQNRAEIRFLTYVKSFIKIFDLSEIDFLIEQAKNLEFRNNVKESYNNLIDGKGCVRIGGIIESYL